MRILKVHNYYTMAGGEDVVFRAEISLLRANGHEVLEYIEQNAKIEQLNKAAVALDTLWSRRSYKKMKEYLRDARPDVAHFDNTFPLISPSAHYACQDSNVPVVYRLHNQRLICPAASFYRNGKLCVDCLGKIPPWPGILHGCYHGSRLHTAVVASMITVHNWLQTWQMKIDAFLCSTSFYRDLFVQAGFPSKKIVVLPLFDHSEYQSDQVDVKSDYAVFVGRLDPEKGVRTLLEAWRCLKLPLKIRGSGRLTNEARAFVADNGMENVEFLEHMSEKELHNLIGNARFLISPSEGYYETFGLVIVESYSRGIPVVASNIGVTPELVSDGKTGLLFEAGNADDLAAKAQWLWDHPIDSKKMGQNALQLYKQVFASEIYYRNLIAVYKTVMAQNDSDF